MGINYVLLGSQRPDVGDSVRPLGRLVRLPEDEIRRLLTAHGPRLFRAYHRRAEAQSLVNQIRALGLRAAVVTASDILEHVFVSVGQLNIGQGGISGLGTEDNAPVFVPFSDVAAVVRGEVSELDRERKVLTPMPGETRIRHEFLRETCVDVHRRSVPIALRIRKSSFRMNPVVAGEPIEGPANLDRFVRILLDRSPLSIFDDGFSRSGDAVDSSLRMLDAGEQVVIGPRALGEEAPSTPPELPSSPQREESELTSISSFDLYSTLWRYQSTVE